MSPERKAGVLFIAIVACLLAMIVLILVSQANRSLLISATFSNSRGLDVGELVQMNGVAIGEVDAVNLSDDSKFVTVQLKIEPEHRTRVRKKSVAYIRNSTFPNVSGQRIVEIENSRVPSPQIESGDTIPGLDSTIEVESWKLREKVGEWSERVREAGAQMSETLRSEYADLKNRLGEPQPREAEDAIEIAAAAEAPEEVAPPIAEEPASAPHGIEVADNEPTAPPTMAEPTPTPALAPTAPPPVNLPPLQRAAPPAGSPSGGQGLEEAMEILSEYAASDEFRLLVDRVIEILTRMATIGVGPVIYDIIRDWEELKTELGPALHALREAGKAALYDQMDEIVEEIENQIAAMLEALEELGGEVTPAPPGVGEPGDSTPIRI